MEKSKRIYILWNSNDVGASRTMIQYALNTKKNKWWEEIIIIIAGAVKMVVENIEIQELIISAMHNDIKFSASKVCADKLGITKKLLDIGIDSIHWGESLVAIAENNEELITV
jgi:hypothetical protein